MLELCWRAKLVEANLQVQANRWCRSDGYDRLDGSEKGAVSYFHGMTMAQVACDEMLNVPSLVHLDRVLEALGKKTKASRPDFLGVHPLFNTPSVAVEAKGRTNEKDQKALDKAKIQAKKLPVITGVGATMAVASMSYFDVEGGSSGVPVWRCRLEDPPRQRTRDEIARTALIALHYQPLVRAVAGSTREQRGEFSRWELPSLDAWLWLPSGLVEVGASLGDAVDLSQLEATGAALEEQLAALYQRESLNQWADVDPDKRSRNMLYMGANGVGLELGDSWEDRVARDNDRAAPRTDDALDGGVD